MKKSHPARQREGKMRSFDSLNKGRVCKTIISILYAFSLTLPPCPPHCGRYVCCSLERLRVRNEAFPARPTQPIKQVDIERTQLRPQAVSCHEVVVLTGMEGWSGRRVEISLTTFHSIFWLVSVVSQFLLHSSSHFHIGSEQWLRNQYENA